PELQSFLRNPARGFLRGRLDMALPYRDDARGDDREPQGDNALLRYQVVSALVEREQDDAALRARALLPPGHEGAGFAADARTRAALLREAVADWRGDVPPVRIERAIALPGLLLDARIADVHEGRRAVALAGSMKGKHRLRGLLEHLALAAVLGEDARTRLFWLETTREGLLELATADMPSLAPAAATARLADLAALWRQGQSRPLPFAPDAAFAWLEKLDKGEGAAWKAACDVFEDRNGFGD